MHLRDSDGGLRDFSQWRLWDNFASGNRLASLEHADEMAARQGREERHPFHDQKLVEFALAVPAHQKRALERDKTLHRDSGYIPQKIAENPSNGEFGMVMWYALSNPCVIEILLDLEIAKLGWVDQARVNAEVNAIQRQTKDSRDIEFRYLKPLWLVFETELWYKHTQYHRPNGTDR